MRKVSLRKRKEWSKASICEYRKYMRKRIAQIPSQEEPGSYAEPLRRGLGEAGVGSIFF